MLVFDVKDVTDSKLTNMNLYFPVGLPKGHDIIKAGVTLTPKLVSLTPNAGSISGTMINAFVPGVGTATTGLSLIRKGGNSVCNSKTLKVTSYGKVECWTNIEDFGKDALEI